MKFTQVAILCFVSVTSAFSDAENGSGRYVSTDELQALEERLTNKFESENNHLTEKTIKLESENKLLLQKVKWLEMNLKRERTRRGTTQYGTAVAFQASLSGDKDHLGKGQTILYNDVITNVGNAYNPNDGLFTCPVSGIYVFHSDTVAGASEYIEAEFNVNGQSKHVYALSDHIGIGWDQGSMSIVLELKQGDLVGVKIHWPPGANTLHGASFCSFSGYLINELEQGANVIGK